MYLNEYFSKIQPIQSNRFKAVFFLVLIFQRKNIQNFRHFEINILRVTCALEPFKQKYIKHKQQQQHQNIITSCFPFVKEKVNLGSSAGLFFASLLLH